LLVIASISLFLKTSGDLDTFEEANREPNVLSASVFLKGECQVFFIFVLPSDYCVSLALEVCLAGNQTAVQNLVDWLLIRSLLGQIILNLGVVFFVTALTFLDCGIYFGHYLHVMF
jgi:hypothetical protein